MIQNSKSALVKPGIILLGFISLVSQVILLREFLTFFSGNELVIGIILANWMLLTGLGAYLGRFFKSDDKRKIWILVFLGVLAFLPTVSVLLLHIIWHSIFLPGVTAGVLHVFYYSMFILAPFCIVSGILFTLLSKQESIICRSNKIGDVYAWESLGSLVGGLILNFVLIWVLSTFQSLFLIMFVVSVTVLILSIRTNYFYLTGIIFFITIAFSFLFLNNDLDKQIRKMAFPGQEITFAKDSPFGVFVITKQNGQTNYYENNVLMASSGDVVSREESVHLSMVQHPDPKNVLVLSGITSGIVDEIVKYPIESIDYVDVNPEVMELAKKYFKAESYQSLKLIKKDAIRYIKHNTKKYDVVMINLPKPSTIQLNRYYTSEFFGMLKDCLSNNAVVSLSLPSSANYLNEESKKFLSIIYGTLQSEFKNVMVLPVGQDFLLASDAELSYQIAERIDQRNIQNEYVNPFYFDDELLKMRSQQITGQLNPEAPLNKYFSPVFYQSQIKLWMSRFNIQYWIPAILIILFSGFFFVKAGRVYKGVFAAGFAGTSIEIVLMLVFQVLFGYVYAVAGVFIMIFMGGLALGSYYIPKLRTANKKLFRDLQISVAIFSFVLPAVFFIFKNLQIHDAVLFILFTFFLLVISILTGAIFSVASKIIQNDYASIASTAYGLDLLGAATGALLFTIYLIPMLGFGWSVFVVGIFNLAVINYKE